MIMPFHSVFGEVSIKPTNIFIMILIYVPLLGEFTVLSSCIKALGFVFNIDTCVFNHLLKLCKMHICVLYLFLCSFQPT
jgi:hypothetical protein